MNRHLGNVWKEAPCDNQNKTISDCCDFHYRLQANAEELLQTALDIWNLDLDKNTPRAMSLKRCMFKIQHGQ